MCQTKNLNIAQIITPLPIFDYLDYKIPDDGCSYNIGDYVFIPIGSKIEIGIISHLKDKSEFKKLKFIQKKHFSTPLNTKILDFIHKVANYTLSPIGYILKAVLRGLIQDDAYLTTEYLQINQINDGKLTDKRQEIINFLQENTQEISATVCRKKFSASIIRQMIKSNQLKIVKKATKYDYSPPNIAYIVPTLSTEQIHELNIFKEKYQNDLFLPFLLDGVTGSGKTELYLEMLTDIWQKDPSAQILIMIPEIGLINQSLERFKKRFGHMPAIWHSQMGAKERILIRNGIVDGAIKCVIGARSGLFLPFKNLKMIIIDEEHDQSYKQEEGFRYHGRDMAVLRAQIEKIVIILASATPSMESYVNAETGRYHKLTLRQRYGKAVLPHVNLIDLKQSKLQKDRWICDPLKNAIMEAAFNGEQSLLFLNRRGYAPLMICQGCGYRIECPFCSAWVVYHRHYDFLKCHQCGQTSNRPSQCGSCGAADQFRPCGPGVERVLEEANLLFPHLKAMILSSDYQKNTQDFKALLDKIYQGDIDILIGTQMIAKGHHFPHLTCVGIIDADLGLKGGDFRAFERSFQILEQVSGRAGRTHKQGHVYVQTYNPHHPVMTALSNHDRDSFLEFEVNNRLEAQYPPFGRMAALILSSENEKKLTDFMRFMVKNQPNQTDDLNVFGPAPAPIFMLRGRYRYRFLIKSKRHILPQAYIKYWLSAFSIPNDIRLHIDIDPITFL